MAPIRNRHSNRLTRPTAPVDTYTKLKTSMTSSMKIIDDWRDEQKTTNEELQKQIDDQKETINNLLEQVDKLVKRVDELEKNGRKMICAKCENNNYPKCLCNKCVADM